MPNIFDTEDPFAAALEHARQGYRTKKRSQIMDLTPKSDDHLAETQDELLPKNQSAFQSGLQWIGRPGQVVKNILTGNLEGAARQAGDFLLDPVDAVLPGDLIPELSRKQDEIQGSQLLGLDDDWRKEHPFLNMAVSLPVDIATDPLTFLGFGPLAKAAGAIGKGAAAAAVAAKIPRAAEIIQAVKDTGEAVGRGARSIAGEERLTPEVAAARQAASAAKATVGETAAAEAGRIFAGYTPKELEVAGDVADGLVQDASGRPLSVLPGDSIGERLAAHPEGAGLDPGRIEKVIQESQAFMERQGIEGGLGGAAPDVGQMLKAGGRQMGAAPDLPIFTAGPGIADYLPRKYGGVSEEQALEDLIGGKGQIGMGQSSKERQLLTPQSVLEHFEKNPQLTRVRNLSERVGQWVGQQAELAKRAIFGEQILQAVKEGRLQIPQSELERISKEVIAAKAVQLGENVAADIAPRAASPGDTLAGYGVGSQSGTSASLGGNSAIDLTGQTGTDLNTAGKMGEFSGTSAPPAAMQMMITKGMRQDLTDLGYTKGQINAMLPDDAVLAIKQQQGPLRAGGIDMLGGAGPKVASDTMGIGDLSGLAKTPKKSAPVDLMSGMGPKIDSGLVGDASGIALPPSSAASNLDLLGGAGPRIRSDIYGVGSQSGKGVGRAKGASQAIDPLASLAGESKPISDLSRTMDHIMNHEFRLTDPASRSIVAGAIKGLDPENARFAHDMMNGLKPRGPVMQKLAQMNHVVKPMMVYGYVIPKIGTDVSNAVSGAWQAFSNPATRGTAFKAMARIPETLYGSIVDSLGLKLPKDQMGKVIALYDQTLKKSGGIASKALDDIAAGPGVAGFTGRQIADVYRSGAPGGFVDTEGFLKTMASTKWNQRFKHITEWPARMFKGIEDRMRVGMGLELTKEGKSLDEIGRFTNEALYNYDISSAGNRAARDILPFAQFTMKAIPQQMKLLIEKPWLAVGMSSLMTEKEGQPVYPYMEGKLNIPLGVNEQGQQNYLSGTRLPFESLGMIPNPSGSLQQTGRDLARIGVGSSQPLLKTAFAAIAGKDPYFDTPFGSYSKVAGQDLGGFGRAYNIAAGAGLAQPLAEPLRLASKLSDDRTTPAMKAIDLLTGANVVSVDENKALQQRLSDYLKRNPNVQSYESLFSKSDDPETKALLAQLHEARKRIKASKKSAVQLP